MLERLELEAFLTLAEELHFGRTANRLGLTTSRISQTIRRLERRIGAALFERNSRKVTLTNVGRQLRDDLRPAYDQINAGIAAASRGNVVPGTLMVGFSGPWCGNLMVTRHHRADPVLRTPRTDGPYRTSLRATRVDIAGRPRRHHTAADSIPQYWMDYYFPRRTPTGRPIPQGPAAQFWPEVLVHVSQGIGVSTVVARAEQFHSRPGMAFVPFHDAPPIDYGLMWPTANRNPLRRPYIDILEKLATAEAGPTEHLKPAWTSNVRTCCCALGCWFIDDFVAALGQGLVPGPLGRLSGLAYGGAPR